MMNEPDPWTLLCQSAGFWQLSERRDDEIRVACKWVQTVGSHTEIEYCSGFYIFSNIQISADPKDMVYDFNYKVVSTEIKTILQKCKSFFFFFLDFACLKKSRVESYLIWEGVACCLCVHGDWLHLQGLLPMLTISRYTPPMICCPQNSTIFWISFPTRNK
jgi:hypothetical protein